MDHESIGDDQVFGQKRNLCAGEANRRAIPPAGNHRQDYRAELSLKERLRRA
jgi:hypothetical protein